MPISSQKNHGMVLEGRLMVQQRCRIPVMAIEPNLYPETKNVNRMGSITWGW